LKRADGSFLTEAHHIKPYNKKHRGDDRKENLVVLCPNCHAQFDDSYFAIHPDTNKVHCIFGEDDPKHETPLLILEGHNLGVNYLQYAWKEFERKKQTL
ncbi:HNH endonuclease signature motif containing protein, partial [Bacillus solitudinis]